MPDQGNHEPFHACVKVLSLHEPWASAIVKGLKTIETRGWQTHHRGMIAIHATKAIPPYAWVATTEAEIGDPLAHRLGIPQPRLIDYFEANTCGRIIAVANLYACVAIGFARVTRDSLILAGYSAHEFDFGDFSVGRYMWMLQDVQPVVPVAVTGRQGLWTYDGPLTWKDDER